MNEESKERVTREQVIEAYKPFALKGLGDPAQIGSDNPEAAGAFALEAQ